ncbi:MAG: MarR family winged helix-turn-helix transcriptional regulator [Nocardioidaceae bacterium]
MTDGPRSEPGTVVGVRMTEGLEQVEYELMLLIRRSRQRTAQMSAQIHPSLDIAGYLILVAIKEGHDHDPLGVRATDIADSFGVHKSTISRALGQLEEFGLVTRVPDEEDGRARRIHLTSAAEHGLALVAEQRRVRLAAVLSPWRPEDLRSLAQSLAHLNTDMG